jgi:hypothetical protein
MERRIVSGFFVTAITIFVLMQALAMAVCYFHEIPLQQALRTLVPTRPKIPAKRETSEDNKPLCARLRARPVSERRCEDLVMDVFLRHRPLNRTKPT